MRLTLWSEPEGVAARDGIRVVYDVARDVATLAPATVDGRALVWELAADDGEPTGALLSARVTLDESAEWVVRCDRVDFPPGSVAYRHVHPGPGIRCLLRGSLRVETAGHTAEYGPGEAWFESGPEPVYAAASPDEATAFVRVMLLPAEWAGRRTIRYVDAADGDKPKRQTASILLEEPLRVP